MGYMHCDVKHENFLVSSAGHVVLADFGLAEPVRQALALFENGTYGYMAPEMLFPGLFGRGVVGSGVVDVDVGLTTRGMNAPSNSSERVSASVRFSENRRPCRRSSRYWSNSSTSRR